MRVSPLSRKLGLVEDLVVANELRPDVLEIRSDQIPALYYDMIQAAAEKIGCSLLLTLKQPVRLLSPEIERLLSRVDYVDVDIAYFEQEADSVREVPDFLRKANAYDVQLIVSFHSFKPSTLEEVQEYVRLCIARMEKIIESYGISAIPKIAATPRNVEEALSFMKEIRQQMIARKGANARWIGVPMGEESKAVRMMGVPLGSMFVYAYLVEPNAPGQIPLYCLPEN